MKHLRLPVLLIATSLLAGCGSSSKEAKDLVDHSGQAIRLSDYTYDRPGAGVQIVLTQSPQSFGVNQLGNFTDEERAAILKALDAIPDAVIKASGITTLTPVLADSRLYKGVTRVGNSILFYTDKSNNARTLDPTWIPQMLQIIQATVSPKNVKPESTADDAQNQDVEGASDLKPGDSVVSESTPRDYVPMATTLLRRKGNLQQLGRNVTDVHPVTIIPAKKTKENQ